MKHIIALTFLLAFCLVMTPLLSATVGHEDLLLKSLPEGSTLSNPDTVTVTVEILRFRAMTVNTPLPAYEFKITINNEPSLMDSGIYRRSDCWFDNLSGSRTIDYDPSTAVDITITVTERSLLNTVCDISPRLDILSGRAVILSYDIKRGSWSGDDYLGDSDGYGHTSGFADGNEHQQDAEIWFTIYQVEADCAADRITYWEKTNIYGLDVNRSYSGQDTDQDGIPIEWEDAYGYDPFEEDDHHTLDPDQDGLTNLEEYAMAIWLADPFSQNIYIEMDGMNGPFKWSPPYMFSDQSAQLLCNAFTRHNITVIIDDGLMGEGGELLPYDNLTSFGELRNARDRFFLHWNHNNPRRGIFHYALICAQIDFSRRPAGGCAFAIDSFVIGGQYVKNWRPSFTFQGSDYITAFASVYMHELGHTLGLNNFEGIDNENSRFPWNEEFWEWGPYKSCMNYRYVYKIVDYSVGDDDDHDQNDWEVIDLARFSRNT